MFQKQSTFDSNKDLHLDSMVFLHLIGEQMLEELLLVWLSTQSQNIYAGKLKIIENILPFFQWLGISILELP